jgi:saccharopine dehydrogenase-like NADP-dependent oxidoreductase
VAATNAARYLKDGRLVEVPGSQLFAEPEIVSIKGAGEFEGYPNRDALPYIKMYGLDNVKTMFRGTLRHLGHCETWYRWVRLGLFDQTPRTDLDGLTFKKFMKKLSDAKGDIKQAVARKMGVSRDHPAVTKLDWLGMFDNTPLPIDKGGNVDIAAARMLERCRFEENERDMIAMRHEFVIQYPDRSERIQSTLLNFGIRGGDSSMARTVSLPVAIAVRMIAEGALTTRGVIAPVEPAVYNPILDELQTMDITFVEEVIE